MYVKLRERALYPKAAQAEKQIPVQTALCRVDVLLRNVCAETQDNRRFAKLLHSEIHRHGVHTLAVRFKDFLQQRRQLRLQLLDIRIIRYSNIRNRL